MSLHTHIDTGLLQGYIDNLSKAVVQQMLDLYLSQSAIYLDEIALTVSSDKQKEWQESCHKMKGAAGSVGLLLVHKKLASIEKITESDVVKNQHIDELRSINQEACTEFTAWLSKA